jgi:1-acyl-sn-glycerol-3-phosphate acyltransferase
MLGWLARFGGALFIERRSRASLPAEVEAVTRELASGLPVVLFAEGTSSDGSSVLPFHRPLFRAAVRAGKPVLPVCITYESIDGAPVTSDNRDCLFYYGDRTFGQVFWRLLGLRRVCVRLDYLEPIHPGTGKFAHRALCDTAYRSVAHCYRPIPATGRSESCP